jgi:DNA-binding XRE family transcriptional regulator
MGLMHSMRFKRLIPPGNVTSATVLPYRSLVLVRLRQIRESKGMTQRSLAEKAKMSYVYISNLENGKANVSLFTLQKLARVLKVRVGDLVADE